MHSPSASTTAPLCLPPGIPASARTALRLLQRLQHGSLTLRLPDGSLQHFGPGGVPSAALTLHNWNVFAAALRSGDIGFAESYFAGDWTTPQLTDLLKLLIANRHAVQDMVYGHWAGRLLYRLRHLLHRNTRRGSRSNIQAHYDLGNAFYQRWLDPSMNYSSAWFQGDLAGDLTQAQRSLDLVGQAAFDAASQHGVAHGLGGFIVKAGQVQDVPSTRRTFQPGRVWPNGVTVPLKLWGRPCALTKVPEVSVNGDTGSMTSAHSAAAER